MLTDEQRREQNKLLDALDSGENEVVLAGPAGTGKTTLSRDIAEQLEARGRNILLVAPTGKAAYRQRVVTGRYARTMHRLLYKIARERDGDLQFSGQNREIQQNDVVLCDEASMVNTELRFELLDQLVYGAAVIWVGDREQLQPVSGTWGPNFDAPTAVLTEVHRQALGNPIIRVATAIRNTGSPGFQSYPPAYRRERKTEDWLASWVAEHVNKQSDAILLCYTRDRRKTLNAKVRRLLGYQDAVVVGDRLKIALNNLSCDLMNGEVVTVTNIVALSEDTLEVTVKTLDGREATAKLIPSLIAESVEDFFKDLEARGYSRHARDNWFHVDYGYALTVHSSQGSEFEHVAFVHDSAVHWLRSKDADQARRLFYTAATRAAKTLLIADVA